MKKNIRKFISTLIICSMLCMIWAPYKTMAASLPGVQYCAHVQDNGWLPYVKDGAGAGSVGYSLRAEALKIQLYNANGGVKYQVHVQDQGWTNWVSNGAQAGTTGLSRRVEAIKIQLTGNIANSYDIYYRTHIQNIGWTGWSKNGAISGTTGQSLRMEAFQIQLVKKGASPKTTSNTAQNVKPSTGQQIANYACQFLGNPYVWGGTSLTNGCDCSGFVMSVYAHFGVSLPHSSSAIRGYGTSVSLNNIMPGDIVCYEGHVGIYVGNNQIISASNKKDGIKYSSVTYKSIITIRRIFQ